jgi:putative oxidoreductase
MNGLLGESAQARMLSVLRIVFGLLFLQIGMAKILGFPHFANYDAIKIFQLLWFAGWIELITGALMVLGLFTRPAAFLASGEMALAYFYFINRPARSFFPLLNGGTLEVTFCFVFLYLAVAGGGAWSLDALRARRR